MNSNIRLLEELLENFETNGATAEEMELCKELAANCDKLRPNLSKLAEETDDKGDSLGILLSFFKKRYCLSLTKILFVISAEILHTSDELGHILERYETFMEKMKQTNMAPKLQGAALDLLDLGPILPSQPSPRSALDDHLLLGRPNLNLCNILKSAQIILSFLNNSGLDDFTPVSPSLNLLQPFKLESNSNGNVRAPSSSLRLDI